ncbi:MAG: hypothetical protein A6D91_09285 [Bacillaceae bacterium G1]|jgi:EAL domain-containing protein (putative c-di-GMP-specific phosphodiesterase class I)|nr:EAL domain-containing protein [Bacillota bacterium]OJF16551.1 MAG: hypothetical protein A6D91_09285 [Bacillaceae bacterium G1]
MDRSHYSHDDRIRALDRLIADCNLVTYFQPIVELKSRRAIGFEVLNRPHAAPEFADASDLYRFASAVKQVSDLDRVCRQLGIRRFAEAAADDEAFRTMKLFLNVHPDALDIPGCHSQETLDMLREHRLSPQQIVLEITEQGAIHDFDQFEYVLTCFNEKGFHIAIDDFGTGYNSLQTIVYIQPHIIKVDRSIVRDIHQRERQQKLVEIVLQYAREIGALVLAEGVESEAEAEQLTKMGVDLTQGYLFGVPSTDLHCFRHLLQ